VELASGRTFVANGVVSGSGARPNLALAESAGVKIDVWSTIGDHQLKYSAWGDGFDRADLVEGPEGWAVWYSRDGSVAGVLAENWDSAYERGQSLIERGAPLNEALDSSEGGE
jgi:hypothetical protein